MTIMDSNRAVPEQTSKREPPKLICALCNITVATAFLLKEHLASDAHKRILDSRMQDLENEWSVAESSSTDDEDEANNIADQQFQRAVAIGTTAGASWTTFTEGVKGLSSGTPVIARRKFDKMFYHGTLVRHIEEKCWEVSFETNGDNEVDREIVPTGSIIVPQRLAIGQEVYASRIPGGYVQPGVVVGNAPLLDDLKDGYYVQFDSDEATVLCSRYDVVVPHFKQHMLKKMTFEEEVHLLQSEMEMK
eukprot:m.103197 g.103197  ORF g.103197 m.103197 type:complete len:248 (+) comp13802_c0_seq2:3139-3882(+)